MQKDLALLTNRELYHQKLDLVNRLVRKENTLGENLYVNYHGIFLNLKCSKKSINDLVKKLTPDFWRQRDRSTGGISIELFSASDFNIDGQDWESEGSPECFINIVNGVEFAVQRDFVGAMKGSRVVAIINEEIFDGFYNVLRWIMPRLLLEKNKIVLHSSCVVLSGKASFFLGHSGYGKSTITELFDDCTILGDDMNILTYEAGEYFAEGAALGGLYDNKRILGEKYPVKNFFWLNKSENNRVERMDKAEASRKFISSCANIFWGDTNETVENMIMNLSMDIVKQYDFQNLYFSLDKGFMKYVK